MLRKSLKEFANIEVSMADVERDVRRVKGIDLKGKLQPLQEPMNESLRIYQSARDALKARFLSVIEAGCLVFGCCSAAA